MLRITDVVKNLIIINLIVYFGATLLPGIDHQMLYLFPPGSESTCPYKFQPYQIISHMFMHGGVTHLLSNMLGLFFFGPPLEARLGG